VVPEPAGLARVIAGVAARPAGVNNEGMTMPTATLPAPDVDNDADDLGDFSTGRIGYIKPVEAGWWTLTIGIDRDELQRVQAANVRATKEDSDILDAARAEFRAGPEFMALADAEAALTLKRDEVRAAEQELDGIESEHAAEAKRRASFGQPAVPVPAAALIQIRDLKARIEEMRRELPGLEDAALVARAAVEREAARQSQAVADQLAEMASKAHREAEEAKAELGRIIVGPLARHLGATFRAGQLNTARATAQKRAESGMV
jgi:hypothetical protein